MVEHHLLLPDVAIRRDLTDPATIKKVADAVGDAQLLGLLAALTEADSLATGPSAWGSWKAQLVADLVERTRLALDGRATGRGHQAARSPTRRRWRSWPRAASTSARPTTTPSCPATSTAPSG